MKLPKIKFLRSDFQAGFTLIELLVVITLIGILAVAILSTLNPLEQVNKAKDARKRGDSSQLLNAIDRYFAANLQFPWTEYDNGGTPLDTDDTFGGAAYLHGVGICGESGGTTTGTPYVNGSGSGGCTYDGLLIDTEELKGQFAERSYFESSVSDAETLWFYKEVSDPTTYVCFKPAAKVNKDKAEDTDSVLKVLTFDANDYVTSVAQCDPGTAPASLDWTSTKENWCFMCVPE